MQESTLEQHRRIARWLGDWRYEAEASTGPDDPSFAGKGTSRYRDAMELVSPDERVLTSMVLEGDGRWEPFMTARYRRDR